MRVKKGIITVLILFLILSNAYAQEQSKTWKLTDADIQQAIKTGKEMKDNISILYNWIVGGASLGQTWVIIATPFITLARYVSNEWRKYKEPSEEEIQEYLRLLESNLLLVVNVYGDKASFAKDYHCVIKIADKIIQPVYIDNTEVADMTDEWPNSLSYEATNFYFFPTKDIPRDAKIEIIVIGDKEEHFTVDLGKIP